MAGFCTNCGTQRPDGARFCAQCGSAFAEAVPADAVAMPEAQVSDPLYPGVEEEVASGPEAVTEAVEVEPVVVPPHSPPEQPVHPVAFTPPPSPPSNRTPLLIGGIAVAALVVGGLAWWAFSDIPVNGIQPKSEATTDKGVIAAAPTEAPEVAYVDNYLSPADEAMVTRGPVAVLAVPGDSATPPLRSLPEGAPLTGRWVRGTDGSSRWFRVASGGYLPAAAVVAPSAVEPERWRPFDMDAAFTSGLRSYFSAASSEHQRAMDIARKKGADEVAANGFAAVPGRSMHGLTVTGVGSHWEASTVLFRENVATVRAALQAEGWRVAPDGTVDVGDEPGVTCSIGSTSQWPEFARFGSTVLSCGV